MKDKLYQYIQDRIDEVYSPDLKFTYIDEGREYVNKFNGLLIWNLQIMA